MHLPCHHPAGCYLGGRVGHAEPARADSSFFYCYERVNQCTSS